MENMAIVAMTGTDIVKANIISSRVGNSIVTGYLLAQGNELRKREKGLVFNIIDSVSGDYKRKTEAGCSASVVECHIVTDYRTFIEDYLKIVEFIEWLKDFYPEKAKFLTKKS